LQRRQRLQGNDRRPALIKAGTWAWGVRPKSVRCNKSRKLKRNVADAADRGQRNKVDEIAFGTKEDSREQQQQGRH